MKLSGLKKTESPKAAKKAPEKVLSEEQKVVQIRRRIIMHPRPKVLFRIH